MYIILYSCGDDRNYCEDATLLRLGPNPDEELSYVLSRCSFYSFQECCNVDVRMRMRALNYWEKRIVKGCVKGLY